MSRLVVNVFFVSTQRFSTAQDSDVRPINLAQLILEMVNDINTNLKEKVEAVRVSWLTNS